MDSMPTLADGRLLWRETATATYLEPLALSAHPRLRCAFTTRHAGRSGQSLNLSFEKGERTAVLAHRQHVLQALGLEQTTYVPYARYTATRYASSMQPCCGAVTRASRLMPW
jgi:hypothetical protein